MESLQARQLEFDDKSLKKSVVYAHAGSSMPTKYKIKSSFTVNKKVEICHRKNEMVLQNMKQKIFTNSFLP